MSGRTVDGKRFHSVILDEAACKGCTVCVTSCPAEAIRVRDGKALILDERCIDCGECIKRCPNHAKKARANPLAALTDPEGFGRFRLKIALPAPSLYGQFPERYGIPAIHEALRSIGFDAVYPVAAATPAIAAATRELLTGQKGKALPRPLISSSCPTIIKFVQIRFPTLLEHIVPVIAPMDLAGHLARAEALRLNPNLDETDIGCFFITPCSGKITEAIAPLGGGKSPIDGVFSMADLHLPILAALGKIRADATQPSPSNAQTPASQTPASPSVTPAEIAWGHSGGEAEASVIPEGTAYIAVDGMDRCVKILELVENGKLDGIEFLELMACPDGCVGGPLSAVNPSLARHTIADREKRLRDITPPNQQDQPTSPIECLRSEPFSARPALLLDPDYKKAMEMMERMEAIYEGLPGLDCGCCGAPNCHALAEDIVRGNASRTDCVIILKEQYQALCEKDSGSDE